MKKIILFLTIAVLSFEMSFAAGNKVFLDNVAERQTIAGITFQKSTFGQAIGSYNEANGAYNVETRLFNLPKLPQWYLYQWWIVEPGSRIHIPAGEVIFPPTTSSTRVNETLKFSSDRDLRAYTQYSLTVERGGVQSSPSNNVILFGDMDFRLIRSISSGSDLKGSKNLSSEDKFNKLKEKASTISTPSRINGWKVKNNPRVTAPEQPVKVKTAASIIGPRIETNQQKIILSRLSRVSEGKLRTLRSRLPEIKNRFRDQDATVRDRSAKIRIINDIETVIQYLLNQK